MYESSCIPIAKARGSKATIGKKNFNIKLGGAYAVDLKAYHGEKIEIAMFSNVYKNLLVDYKVKIDDIKNRIDG